MKMKKKELRGVMAMLVTPFDQKENVDFGALRGQVQWCIEQGVHGVTVTPSIGEATSLFFHERVKCMEVCMESLSKFSDLFSVAMIVGTHTREVREYARVAKALGYDAGQLNPCYYWTMSEASCYRLYSEVAEEGLPIVIYNNPRLSKFDISPKLFGKLIEIPGIVGIKETKTDRHVDLEPLFRAVRGKTRVFVTYRVFTTGLLLGADGGFINVFAVPACMKLWNLFRGAAFKSHLIRAEKIQEKLNEVFPRGHEGSPDILGVTKMMASVITGIPMGPPRSPYFSAAEETEQQLRKKLPELMELIKD